MTSLSETPSTMFSTIFNFWIVPHYVFVSHASLGQASAARQVLFATCLEVKQPMLPAIAVEVATAVARLPALRPPSESSHNRFSHGSDMQ